MISNFLENADPAIINQFSRNFPGQTLSSSPTKLLFQPIGSTRHPTVNPISANKAVKVTKPTITPFGPILPTSANLLEPHNFGSFFGRMQSSNSVQQPPQLFASQIMTSRSAARPGSVPLPVSVQSQPVASSSHLPHRMDKAVGTSQLLTNRPIQKQTAPSIVAHSKVNLKKRPSEIIRRILANDPSSESEAEERGIPKSPLSDHKSTRRNSHVRMVHQHQAATLRVVSPAPASPRLPVDAVSSPPRRSANRFNKKRQELEKVQQFLEESRVAHEKIYSGFDVRRLSTSRGKTVPANRRSLSRVRDANNIAELRRNIAKSSKREESPLPPLPKAHPGTLSASSRSPNPASPNGIVSGVFVSYPRRRSTSAPPEEQPISPSRNEAVLSSLRATKSAKKMTTEEYAELRKNLLTRSEQHVTG